MKWLTKVKLFLRSPKNGDIYYGDAKDFALGRSLEKALHGVKDKSGDDIWAIIPGQDTYRLIMESTAMPTYYRLEAEVLAFSMYDPMTWLKRRVPRRIDKNRFHEMILEGKVVRK